MPRQMGGAKPYSSDAWDAGRAVEEMCSRRTRRARRRVVGAMRVGWRVIVLSTIAGAAGTIKSMGDGFDDENVKGSASKPRGGGLVPGGAVVPPRMCRHERGLSPRVRGYPYRTTEPRTARGSIPAGAGSPDEVDAAHLICKVYPRGCGVTPSRPVSTRKNTGLSPRVRGHHRRGRADDQRHGSIPAGAGSPDVGRVFELRIEVYPRGCGVTIKVMEGHSAREGLSPRVRGHRV